MKIPTLEECLYIIYSSFSLNITLLIKFDNDDVVSADGESIKRGHLLFSGCGNHLFMVSLLIVYSR